VQAYIVEIPGWMLRTVFGTSRKFTSTHQFGRNRRHSGHAANLVAHPSDANGPIGDANRACNSTPMLLRGLVLTEQVHHGATGSKPFALITSTAPGPMSNLIKALAAFGCSASIPTFAVTTR
jgi:hypothetical protein